MTNLEMPLLLDTVGGDDLFPQSTEEAKKREVQMNVFIWGLMTA